jgi:hypothetical protein
MTESEKPLEEAQAFAYEVRQLYLALKEEGFNASWCGEFVKSFFQGAAGK